MSVPTDKCCVRSLDDKDWPQETEDAGEGSLWPLPVRAWSPVLDERADEMQEEHALKQEGGALAALDQEKQPSGRALASTRRNNGQLPSPTRQQPQVAAPTMAK